MLPPRQTWRLLDGKNWQPGARTRTFRDVPSYAVLSDSLSAVAAASHSLLVEMTAPPQEPLSIM